MPIVYIPHISPCARSRPNYNPANAGDMPPRHDGRLASPAAQREVMSQEQATAIHASLPSGYKVRWGRLKGMGAPGDDSTPIF